MNKHTFDAAKIALDATLTAVEDVINNQCTKAYALVRPPGHHAHL
jgi:acetoin utilization deacetylase AcuC-like enzyme